MPLASKPNPITCQGAPRVEKQVTAKKIEQAGQSYTRSGTASQSLQNALWLIQIWSEGNDDTERGRRWIDLPMHARDVQAQE